MPELNYSELNKNLESRGCGGSLIKKQLAQLLAQNSSIKNRVSHQKIARNIAILGHKKILRDKEFSVQKI